MRGELGYSFILVHSPLVGPYSVQPVVRGLERAGHRAVVPSLLPALDRSEAFAQAIAQRVRDAVTESQVSDPVVLVGHSAAGAYLPVIASRLDREVAAFIFLDARLPRRGDSLSTEDSPEEVRQRREMAEDGWLPPWSEWFGEGVMAQVLPEERARERFLDELRPIPLALFEESITFPSDWADAPCGYIRMSEFYKPLAREAVNRGWPVLEIDGDHLGTLTHPDEVVDLIRKMLELVETG